MICFQEVSLSFSEQPLLCEVTFQINRGERIALIGRNGAGKSTLMKLLEGEIKPDSGEVKQRVTVARLNQDVPESTDGTVRDVVLSGFGEVGQLLLKKHPDPHQMDALDGWNIQTIVEATISQVGLDPEAAFASLSGGTKRRVLLAQALAKQPDLLMLDEPTNHLDLASILWLEKFLRNFHGAILLVTHDREFMQRTCHKIFELDRGQLTQFDGTYDKFLAHKAHLLVVEKEQNKQFDKKLAQEEVWIRQGIKARRTRNEGRVRALEQLRRERAERIEQKRHLQLVTAEAEKSGRVVVKAHNVSFAYPNKPVFDAFSTTLMRGDRVAVLGPNGCGKTTLLNVLLKTLPPSQGTIKHGTNLDIAYFDQLRNQLDESQSLADNVGEGREFVTIDGKDLHVLSYLGRFLFPPEQARGPISKLSGGERNRLLLAKLFSKPSNFLVLDEPTNDLDLETLELLESILLDYQGTVLFISHDRNFIDNVASSTIVFEANGVQEYVGGYQDWLRQCKKEEAKPVNEAREKAVPEKSKPKKLSYKEQRRLASLPDEIEALEAEINAQQANIVAPGFYQQLPDVIKTAQQKLADDSAELDVLYALWERLVAQAG